jgi:hypothetical protein
MSAEHSREAAVQLLGEEVVADLHRRAASWPVDAQAKADVKRIFAPAVAHLSKQHPRVPDMANAA